MLFLDVLTILCTGLMIGNELTVSLFINPLVWKLDDSSQAKALSLFAGLLGKVMPFWYALSLILMMVEAFVRRHQPGVIWLLIAIGLWIATIVYTVTILVPISNRIARLTDTLPAGWQREPKKWDMYHRWRIMLLLIAMVCLVLGVLRPC
jgi:uncharacterized membrane protein